MVRQVTRIKEDTAEVELTQYIPVRETTDSNERLVAAPVYLNDRNLQLRLLSQELRAAARELREQARAIRARSAGVRRIAQTTPPGHGLNNRYAPAHLYPSVLKNRHRPSHTGE